MMTPSFEFRKRCRNLRRRSTWNACTDMFNAIYIGTRDWEHTKQVDSLLILIRKV